MTEGLTEAGTKDVTPEKDVTGVLKKRYIQGMMMFSMFFIGFALRLNLSVAIVAMTNRSTANPDFPELDWDLQVRSRVLSSFFWGYLIIQLPAGQLGQLFSVKQLLLIANITCALLALLTPAAAVHGGAFPVCVIRFLQGLSQGFYVPLCFTMASKWVPQHERNRFIGFSLNGGTIGSVVALAVSGLLASGPGGWPSVFYVSGALGLLWATAWWALGADSPATHPSILPRERDYIQSALTTTSHTETHPTPWKKIFTSVPVWALIGTNICNGWGFGIIVTQLPAYINSVLGFPIQQNGFLSALPWLVLWLSAFPVCWLADTLTRRNMLPVIIIRKLFTTLGLGGLAVMVGLLCLVDRNAVVAMTLITVAMSFSAFVFGGFLVNYLDLAPNFAGVLMGLCNGLENVSTILAPLSVGWLVQDPTSVSQWRWVFGLTAAISLLGDVIYVIFAQADIQPWNSPITDTQQNKEITKTRTVS